MNLYFTHICLVVYMVVKTGALQNPCYGASLPCALLERHAFFVLLLVINSVNCCHFDVG